jgi:hypothetical protein
MRVLEFLIEDAYIHLLARTMIAIVLLLAGLAKVRQLHEFSDQIRNYKLLPSNVAVIVGHLLPFFEIVIAINLTLYIIMPWSAMAAASLFLLFGVAIAINILRGRRNISCGCFGLKENQHLTWGQVIRNIALACLAVLAMDADLLLGSLHSPLSSSNLDRRLSFEETIITIFIVGTIVIASRLWATIVALWRVSANTDRS